MRRWCGTCGALLPDCFCALPPKNPNLPVGLTARDYDDERGYGIRTRKCPTCKKRYRTEDKGATSKYCAPCQRERVAKWRAKNPERIKTPTNQERRSKGLRECATCRKTYDPLERGGHKSYCTPCRKRRA